MANSSAPSTAPRHDRVLRPRECRERHSGLLPSSTALDRRLPDSETHHQSFCFLPRRTRPTNAQSTDQSRYLGERSAWNAVWNRAASRYLNAADQMPASVRRCSGTIARRSPPSRGSRCRRHRGRPRPWVQPRLAGAQTTYRGAPAWSSGLSGSGTWPVSNGSAMMGHAPFGEWNRAGCCCPRRSHPARVLTG